jgi:hypothetical protein
VVGHRERLHEVLLQERAARHLLARDVEPGKAQVEAEELDAGVARRKLGGEISLPAAELEHARAFREPVEPEALEN